MKVSLQGIGMTSRRTRERMVNRLLEQGIKSNKILDVMRTTPRHIFVDEFVLSDVQAWQKVVQQRSVQCI